MKTIEAQHQSFFEIYDGKVQKGEWSEHKSKTAKLAIRTDAQGRSYKVYDHDLHAIDRFSRVFAWALSWLLVMPLWSKGAKSLWKEAWIGKEKIKVIALLQPIEEPADDQELSKVVNAIISCTTKLLHEKPDSVALFLKLQTNVKNIEKQFIFTADKTDIEQRIEKYVREQLLGGEFLSETSHYECSILGIANKNNTLFECHQSLSRTQGPASESSHESFSSIVSGLPALECAQIWFQHTMPQVTNFGENSAFLKIEGIYQPV